MASQVSLEYLQSIQGVAGGIATLGDDGIVPLAQLPEGLVNNYKGEFADEAAITAALATAVKGDYTYNTETSSFWYWSDTLSSWVNQEITASAYMALTDAAKADVPYIIIAG